MAKIVFCVSVVVAALAVVASAVAARATNEAAPEPWACTGIKQLNVEFWPTRRAFNHLVVHQGPTRPGAQHLTPVGELAGDVKYAFSNDVGMSGGSCEPKGTLGTLTQATTASTRAAVQMDCTLPRLPLFVKDRQSPTQARLRIVLPPGKVVVTAVMKKGKGSILSYANAYCKTGPPKR